MEGFKLEDKIALSLKREGLHYRRIKTRNSGFKGDDEIADFYVYLHPSLIYLESKSMKGKVLPFSSIRTNQAIGLHEASKTEGVGAGFIVEYREVGQVLYIPIYVIDEQLKKGIKSISYKAALEYKGVHIVGDNELNLGDAIQKITEDIYNGY